MSAAGQGAKRRRSAGSGSSPVEVPFQVVDVFTRTAFNGNPTCVSFPGTCMSDGWLSKLARESGQPTTSFVHLDTTSYRTFDRYGTELPMLSGHSALGVAAAVMARSLSLIHI